MDKQTKSETTYALLTDLCGIDAVSGCEQNLATYVRQRLSGVATHIRIDPLGNVMCTRTPPQTSSSSRPPRIMLAAHLDEIGLRVQWIEKSGALRVLPVGGVDIRTLLGKQVTVMGKQQLKGVVGTMPPHLSTAAERDKIPSWDDLFVDVGLPAEEVNELISLGDAIAFDGELRCLINGRVTGKALDNRAGLAAAILAFETLASQPTDAEIVLAATSQEEIGYRGAVTATHSINPDLAIAIDVGFADTPGIPERRTTHMGRGPSVAIGANLHPAIVHLLRDVAVKEGIPYQVEVLPAETGTDAWVIQTSGQGVPTGLLSIPLRNMHSPVEIVQISDIEHTVALLAALCNQLDMEMIRTWHDR